MNLCRCEKGKLSVKFVSKKIGEYHRKKLSNYPILIKQREINQQKYKEREREKGLISLKYQIFYRSKEHEGSKYSKDLFLLQTFTLKTSKVVDSLSINFTLGGSCTLLQNGR